MAAKAVVVFGPSELPLNNVECLLLIDGTEYRFDLTNLDGYSLLPYGLDECSGYIKVTANGFKSYLQLVILDDQNQTIRIGNPKRESNDIILPPLSFNKPSRDSIINVKGNFCNIYDADGLPILEWFISQLIADSSSKAEDWIARLKDAGSTHITIDMLSAYPENLGWIDRYPVREYNWFNDLKGFSQIIEWLQNRNIIPIVKLSMDGQVYDLPNWTVGWKWSMDNIPNVLSSLSQYHDSCLWSTGWDGCFPNWSPEQIIQALQMLKSVMGNKGNIDTEFGGPGSIGYCHLGNGEADWADDKLGILDCFSTELQTNPAQADGIAQTATRLLGPNAKNCPTEPYYLVNTTKKINMCFFETVAYWFSHKQYCDPIFAANLGKYYGFTSFGNGLS